MESNGKSAGLAIIWRNNAFQIWHPAASVDGALPRAVQAVVHGAIQWAVKLGAVGRASRASGVAVLGSGAVESTVR